MRQSQHLEELYQLGRLCFSGKNRSYKNTVYLENEEEEIKYIEGVGIGSVGWGGGGGSRLCISFSKGVRGVGGVKFSGGMRAEIPT